jgi:hypothetical protein
VVEPNTDESAGSMLRFFRKILLWGLRIFGTAQRYDAEKAMQWCSAVHIPFGRLLGILSPFVTSRLSQPKPVLLLGRLSKLRLRRHSPCKSSGTAA